MRELKLVSLFTGAGGLDYGFEAAGFRTRVALDNDHDSCETIRTNRDWPVVEREIDSVASIELLSTAGLTTGNVDILIGGPPCQPFSKSGYWANGDTRRLDDPRAGTLHSYMRCVHDMMPQVFLLENVHGISYSGKEEGFRLIHGLTEEINRRSGTNYKPTWCVVDAADYGVPQHRKRFFLVADRDGRAFRFPAASHAEVRPDSTSLELPLDTCVSPYATAWDAIGAIGEPSPAEDLTVRGRWAELLPSIPEGENYLWHTNRKGGLPLFGWRTRYWSFLLKLAKNLPSWTIQAQPGPAIGPFHWHNRRLSVAELAGLQTFPSDIRFVGNRLSVQRQIGNAVPSLLAERLARAIGEQLFGVAYPAPPRLAVPAKHPIPHPEPLAPVPDRYRGLIGDHPDHPGTGKGNSYRKTGSEIMAADIAAG